ncbi:MAG: FKBP-type peptidyl-prolyl cis-trans isomerase [Bacteroidales bacterium]|jgi:FKBP-type peptidyl-prolyl cis-trans isomerase|nr:FKBP-type peptidyl-prolyl cis-trans isomerase [Bacteroidales bacterium]NLK81825.1 FKBP-type peptidyl-prolyl cis-trans isomerase [Bacteroidales bacterium]HPY83031.1 FKBP-type peptidyl-prolyl cis-trans isomerase [Bacteroidales bacterium]
MKSLQKFTMFTLVSGMLFSCTNKALVDPNISLKTLTDSASYAIGMAIASDFSHNQIDSLNMYAFVAGFQAFDNPEISQIPESEIGLTINKYMMLQAKKQFPALEAGERFLAENENKEGVVTTESGLQYTVITAGAGESPNMYDTVTVHYHGTTIDGSVFDSSIGGDPVSFVLGQVIEGWNEGLQLMKPGGKMRLFIPSDLGYGGQGQGGIRPFETLIFDVELLSVKKGNVPAINPELLKQMMNQ